MAADALPRTFVDVNGRNSGSQSREIEHPADTYPAFSARVAQIEFSLSERSWRRRRETT